MLFHESARRHARNIILAVIAAALVAALLAPPLAHDPRYHTFADQRTLLGIPNFWNVITNIPFILLGFMGLLFLYGVAARGVPLALRPVYTAFFAGAVLIGCGSSYFHLHPDIDTLVWDRLPMTISFMAFLSALVAETASFNLGRRLFWPLLVVGGLSVVYWYVSELAGQGDLRPYALVQFLPMLLVPLLLLLYPSDKPGRGFLWAVLGFYAAAKVVELLDGCLYESLLGFSGHALKHLLAATGVYCFLLALVRRWPPAPR